MSRQPSYNHPCKMDATTGALLGLGMYLLNNVPWVSIFLFTQFIGIRLYNITDKETILRIQRRLKYASHTSDDGKKSGYAFGKWFLLWISIVKNQEGDIFNAFIISNETSFQKLINDTNTVKNDANDPEKEEQIEINKIKIYERSGNFYNIWYRKRELLMKQVVPRGNQQHILESIEEHYMKNEHSVVLLHGEPGTGKTMIGLMLANKLNASYCNNLIPWHPGIRLGDLYQDVEPTKENPLIICFDEFDNALIEIHNKIPLHKVVPIQITDKPSWNRFLDEINRGMYPYLILILTTNKTPDFINTLDSSYIREGRVDITFAL